MKFHFRFPDVGEGIHEGTIVKWMVQVGDLVQEGDSLAEVETDKVTTEIPSPRTGKILELIGEAGDVINVGDVFVVLDVPGEDIDDKSELEEEETAGVVGEIIASSELIPPSTEEHLKVESPTKSTRKRALATPVARKMAKDLGIDINTLIGTGPNGRVMKEDIRRAANKKDKAKSDDRPSLQDIEVQVEENVEKVSLTRIRQTIAEQMSNSKFTIPHATAMDEFSIKALVDFRNKYKDKLKNQNTKLTYLPFIIKAALVAMKEFPEFNAQLDLDKDKLILKKYYHIGIATDTERGLMVPVVKNAHHMSLVELAKNIEDVSSRAKKNQIQIEELRGSTFTVTNYGSIGGQFGVPIINYPETAILGVGRAVEKPIVIDGEIGIAPMLTLSLSYDHRVIDGAMAARFLNLIKDLLSEPELLLLKS